MSDGDSRNQTIVALTESFISLLQSSKDAEVDLNYAEQHLQAPKRRLHDVVNILSSVGLIEKCGKSGVKWRGNVVNNGQPRDDLALLEERSRELDNLMESVDNCLDELIKSREFKDRAWLTEEDILSLDPEKSMNLFALLGPPTMTVEVSTLEDNSHLTVCHTETGKLELKPIRSPRVRGFAPFLDTAKLDPPATSGPTDS
jgi:transcription factor E2F3